MNALLIKKFGGAFFGRLIPDKNFNIEALVSRSISRSQVLGFGFSAFSITFFALLTIRSSVIQCSDNRFWISWCCDTTGFIWPCIDGTTTQLSWFCWLRFQDCCLSSWNPIWGQERSFVISIESNKVLFSIWLCVVLDCISLWFGIISISSLRIHDVVFVIVWLFLIITFYCIVWVSIFFILSFRI